MKITAKPKPACPQTDAPDIFTFALQMKVILIYNRAMIRFPATFHAKAVRS